MNTNIPDTPVSYKVNSTDLFNPVNKELKGKDNQNIGEVSQSSPDNTVSKVNANAKLTEANPVVPSKEELDEALTVVSTFIDPQVRSVNFFHDDSSGKTVVKIFDVKNQELIKQFPSEKIIEMATHIKSLQNDFLDKTGIFVDSKV